MLMAILAALSAAISAEFAEFNVSDCISGVARCPLFHGFRPTLASKYKLQDDPQMSSASSSSAPQPATLVPMPEFPSERIADSR